MADLGYTAGTILELCDQQTGVRLVIEVRRDHIAITLKPSGSRTQFIGDERAMDFVLGELAKVHNARQGARVVALLPEGENRHGR